MQVTTKHTQSKHFNAKWWAISTCLDSEGTILEPEILILDEATTNLDVINEEEILQMLIALKQTQLIIISHDAYVLSRFKGVQLQLEQLNN